MQLSTGLAAAAAVLLLIRDASVDLYVGRTRIDGLGCGAGLSGAYLGGNVGYASHIVHWEDRDNWWNDGAALPRQSTAWPLQGQGAAGGLQPVTMCSAATSSLERKPT